MSEPIIELSHANIYQGNNLILQDVNLSVIKGEFVYLVGKTGTGKSTLLKAMTRACGIHIWEEERWVQSHFNPHENDLCRYVEVAWTADKKPGAFFSAETTVFFITGLGAGTALLTDFFFFGAM